MNIIKNVDIAIIGGGIVGLTLAHFFRVKKDSSSVTVIDKEDNAQSAENDFKSVIIDSAIADVFTQLGVFPDNSYPLKQIAFSFDGWQHQRLLGHDEILGYSLDHRQCQFLLRQNIDYQTTTLTNIEPTPTSVLLTTDDKQVICARRVVVTCPLTHLLPPLFRVSRFDYHQSILLAKATVSQAMAHRAYQYFSDCGMVVAVPRTDGKMGIIINATHRMLSTVNAFSNEDLSSFLTKTLGLTLKIQGKRLTYCPQFLKSRPFKSGRIVLVGRGATVLHPAGAQSLALAIGDCQHLVAQWHESGQVGLSDYARCRQKVHRQAILTTNLLAANGALTTKLWRKPFSYASKVLSHPIVGERVISFIRRQRVGGFRNFRYL